MKLFRSRSGRILLAAILLLAGFFGLQRLLSFAIFVVHTGNLFMQFEATYGDSLAAGQPPVTTSQEFIDRISHWTIDWNSCRSHDRTIYDSRGTRVEIRLEPSLIEFRSAGPDRQIDTPDDIVRQIPNPAGA